MSECKQFKRPCCFSHLEVSFTPLDSSVRRPQHGPTTSAQPLLVSGLNMFCMSQIRMFQRQESQNYFQVVSINHLHRQCFCVPHMTSTDSSDVDNGPRKRQLLFRDDPDFGGILIQWALIIKQPTMTLAQVCALRVLFINTMQNYVYFNLLAQ